MTVAKPVLKSIAAAVILATVTLLVFGKLRDYGPESAVRRFQQDLITNNLKDLRRVTMEPLEDDSVGQLAHEIGAFFGPGAAPGRIARTDRSPTRVSVVVLYTRPETGGPWPMVWVVDKVGRNWKVNATATLDAYQALHPGA